MGDGQARDYSMGAHQLCGGYEYGDQRGGDARIFDFFADH